MSLAFDALGGTYATAIRHQYFGRTRQIFDRLIDSYKAELEGSLCWSARRAKTALTANTFLYKHGLYQVSPSLAIYTTGGSPFATTSDMSQHQSA